MWRRVLEKSGVLAEPGTISHANLGRFLRETNRHGLAQLPLPEPRSISLVVPLFKHAAFLPEMFQSVVQQTRPPDELIFIDDNSPDDSTQIVKDLLAANPVLESRTSLLVNDRNIGQAASLNRAIATVTSDLVMILNDDDYLMHDVVETMLDLFGRYPELALIGAHSVHFSGSDALAAAPKRIADYPEPALPLTVQRPDQVPGYRGYDDLNMTHSGSCFPKVVWQAVGGYRPKKDRCVPGSDRDFQLRINAIWPVGVAYKTPFSFWRNDSSVDRELAS